MYIIQLPITTMRAGPPNQEGNASVRSRLASANGLKGHGHEFGIKRCFPLHIPPIAEIAETSRRQVWHQ